MENNYETIRNENRVYYALYSDRRRFSRTTADASLIFKKYLFYQYRKSFFFIEIIVSQ